MVAFSKNATIKMQHLFLPRNRNTLRAMTNELHNPDVVGVIDYTRIRISYLVGEEAQDLFIRKVSFF